MTKDCAMLLSAMVTLASGILMSFFAFFMSVDHIINDSVLWYFGQCLMYAASSFGVFSYIKYRFDSLNKNNKT